MSLATLATRRELLAELIKPLEKVLATLDKRKPKFFPLPAGTKIYRISRRSCEPDVLNPNTYADSPGYDPITDGLRFSPFKAQNGRWVSTSYFGETELASMGETLFRDKPEGSDYWMLPPQKIEDLRMHELSIKKDIRLVRLRGTGLKSMGLIGANLGGLPPLAYPLTQRFAQTLYNHDHVRTNKVAGLVWTSRHLDDTWSCMFWARHLPTDWVNKLDYWDLDSPYNRSRLDEMLGRANIVLG